VGLGTATPFAILAGSEVTNTGASVISGDLGVSPATSVTGTPNVIDGSIFKGTAVAATAKAALGTAYTDAAGRSPTTIGNFTTTGLGGKSLVAGVYNATSTLQLTGTLTLNGNGDPNAVFVFQAGSSLITASDSTVVLIGDAQACNVFWKLGSSATLGSASHFVGTILAATSITMTSGVTLQGRALAQTAAVSLIDDTITRPTTCITATSTTSPTPTVSSVSPSSGPTSGGTTVVITGTGLSGVTGATGVVSVTVTAGGQKGTATGAFSYLAATTSPTTTTTTTAPGAGATTTTTSAGAAAATTTTTPGSASSSTANGATVIPLGAPDTGVGGASRSGSSPLLVTLGLGALAGGAASILLAVRRRRTTG
jgi:hypothetical protein